VSAGCFTRVKIVVITPPHPNSVSQLCGARSVFKAAAAHNNGKTRLSMAIQAIYCGTQYRACVIPNKKIHAKKGSNWYHIGWGKVYRELTKRKLHWIRYCRSVRKSAILAALDNDLEVPPAFQDTDADSGWMNRARLAGELRRTHHAMRAAEDAGPQEARGAGEAKEGDGSAAVPPQQGSRLSMSLLCRGRFATVDHSLSPLPVLHVRPFVG